VRLLFVSSTTVGGSGRSQRELALGLLRRGHEVKFLVDDDRAAKLIRWVAEQCADLAARFEGKPGERVASALERRPGRRTGLLRLDGLEHATTAVPQNGLVPMIDRFQPDVVICNSLERLAWRRIQTACADRDVPTVLYVRETDSLDHLSNGQVPDTLVANAESLQAALHEQGFECAFVPSVIDVDVTRTDSTRRVALAINPIESRGGDIIWKLAAEVPEIPIVVQESWELVGSELATVQRHIAELPNVEFRRSVPPGPGLYGDARVLLVPYRVDNRPRVITEAQSNGIPVISADVPALSEAIGAGGVVVPLESIEEWATALRDLWNDQSRYDLLSAAAAEQGRRPEINPEVVTSSFEAIVEELVQRSS
jgi:glycosyltransferase involved in cell wall biosynthesis